MRVPKRASTSAELPVRGRHALCRSLVGGEAGGEHVAAREKLLVRVGVFVVVVDESSVADFEVEQTCDAALADDALRCASDLRGIGEPPGSDPVFEGEESGFGAGEGLGGASGVASGSGVGLYDYRAGAVSEGRFGSAAIQTRHVRPFGVRGDGLEGLLAGFVSVQAGCEHVIAAGLGDSGDVVRGDQAAVSPEFDGVGWLRGGCQGCDLRFCVPAGCFVTDMWGRHFAVFVSVCCYAAGCVREDDPATQGRQDL